ncbi:phosphoserine phosphatase [Salinarchaeum sp. Harcht-Bsk1]|uniref:phosphoserine phosphatase SerB n=1 Tax=Salinarchaeum sp. Harcht-Bsk1 TaxID=1333523 RepID=UPI00034249A7|nr:phosphoserine phosphatase SerB [Salinarchaeum sp. Harcht-Bsk1]AGN00626.1 phosphoserine phosphatase [Salinarchaeum sp. Harcht-Bsk1]
MTLFAFDFDGTLSDSEMTVLLGSQYGVADQMDSITEQAMNDEIEYAESLRQRAALLEDLPDEKAQAAFEEVVLRPGAAEVIADLREAGHHVAILTGGFERGVAEALTKEGVDVDTIVANRLPVEDDALTGEVRGSLIEGTKDEALELLVDDQDLDIGDTVAVGDGANDLPMLQAAGWAIGFEPKEAVAPHCDVEVTTMEALRAELIAEGHLEA